jgi:hypothetical protein
MNGKKGKEKNVQDIVQSSKTPCNANWCKLTMSINKGCTNSKLFSFFQWNFCNSLPIGFIANMVPNVIITLQVLARHMANTRWLSKCQTITILDVSSLNFILGVNVMFLVHALHYTCQATRMFCWWQLEHDISIKLGR